MRRSARWGCRWELRLWASWTVIDEMCLTRALLSIVPVVVPIGVFTTLSAVVGCVAMLTTALTKRTRTRAVSTFRTDWMPIWAALIKSWLNVESGCSWWWRCYLVVDQKLLMEKRIELLLEGCWRGWCWWCLRLKRKLDGCLLPLVVCSLLRGVVWHRRLLRCRLLLCLLLHLLHLLWCHRYYLRQLHLLLLNLYCWGLRLRETVAVERLQRNKSIVVLEMGHDAVVGRGCCGPALFLKPHHHQLTATALLLER